MSEIRRRKPPVIEEREEPEAKVTHGSIGWGKAAIWSFVGAMVLLPLVLWLIPAPIDPVAYTLAPPPEWTGPLAPNNHLQKAIQLYENEIIGPESMVADGDYMYTGTADGKVVEIYKGTHRVLARLGKEPCGKFEDEPTCGRPLGMRIDSHGYLIVVDAYLGLYKINVATGDSFLLWPSSAPINGRRSRLMNDLDIGPDGTMYITDSSTKWDRRHNRYCILEAETSGRLLAYHPDSNTTEELVTGIPFINGVQLTKDKKALLFISTTRACVYKYHLSGADKGKLEMFSDNLPGLPDNIRRSSLGGYWVGLAAPRKPTFSLIDFAANKPWIKKLLTKILSQEMIIKMIPKYGLMIHLDESGKVTRSFHDPTGETVPAVSEVEDHNGILYLGSYNLPFISKLYLNSIKD